MEVRKTADQWAIYFNMELTSEVCDGVIPEKMKTFVSPGISSNTLFSRHEFLIRAILHKHVLHLGDVRLVNRLAGEYFIIVNERVVGTVKLIFDGDMLHIDFLNIHKSKQRLGLGSLVVNALKRLPITMITGVSLRSSLGFWMKMNAVFDDGRLAEVIKSSRKRIKFYIPVGRA